MLFFFEFGMEFVEGFGGRVWGRSASIASGRGVQELLQKWPKVRSMMIFVAIFSLVSYLVSLGVGGVEISYLDISPAGVQDFAADV